MYTFVLINFLWLFYCCSVIHGNLEIACTDACNERLFVAWYTVFGVAPAKGSANHVLFCENNQVRVPSGLVYAPMVLLDACHL
jgi:hypothetical protein